MKAKFLVPAIVFMVMSLFIIIGNIIYIIKGKWGIWTINNWAAVIFHGVTMIIALYLFTGVTKKEKEE